MRLILNIIPLLILIQACSDGQSRTIPPDNPATEIPFTKHGELDFVRSDGSIITSIAIEIADTDSTRERGLMQRSSLPENSGMLFIFQQQQQQSFWMANTRISLDMIFAASDSSIVNIEKYVKPMSPENTRSDGPARFVIEVPAGFADTYGLTESDHVTWRDERN
jgi:hypothetical protein